MIHASRTSMALVLAGALGLISSNAFAQQAPDSDEILQVPVIGGQPDEAAPDEIVAAPQQASAGCAVAPPSMEAPAVQMPVTVQTPGAQTTQTVSVAQGAPLRIHVVVYGPNGIPQTAPAPMQTVIVPAPVESVVVRQQAPQPRQLVWVPTHYEWNGQTMVRVRRGWQLTPVAQAVPAPVFRTVQAPVVQARTVVWQPGPRGWHARHRAHFFGRGI